MCIRDRLLFDFQGNPDWSLDHDDGYETWYMYGAALWLHYICLLYTSDAADERSSVDLGGRRIIKKKNSDMR